MNEKVYELWCNNCQKKYYYSKDNNSLPGPELPNNLINNRADGKDTNFITELPKRVKCLTCGFLYHIKLISGQVKQEPIEEIIFFDNESV